MCQRSFAIRLDASTIEWVIITILFLKCGYQVITNKINLEIVEQILCNLCVHDQMLCNLCMHDQVLCDLCMHDQI